MTPRYQSLDWYDTPRYYDIVFAGRNRQEIDFVEALYQRYAPREGRILEPACGSGRLLEGLARKGYQVDGFDLSEPMVDYARRRFERQGLEGKIWVGDMTSVRTRRRYDLAFCLVSSFKYLLTEREALAHLRCVSASLRSGGVYVLGFHLSDYDDRSRDREDWHGARGRTRVECRIDSWPPNRRSRRENLRARLLVHKPSITEALESEWQFRTYDVRQFRSLLAKVPELEHVATHNFEYKIDEEIEFGDEDLDNVVILRRR